MKQASPEGAYGGDSYLSPFLVSVFGEHPIILNWETILKKQPNPEHPHAHGYIFLVEDIGACLDRIKQNGGEVLGEESLFNSSIAVATCSDPDKNPFTVIERLDEPAI